MSSDDENEAPGFERRPTPAGFRRWMAENVGLVQTLSLVGIYVGAILYVVSLVAFGSGLVSRVIAGITIAVAFVSYMLFRLGGEDSEGRSIWEIYRSPGTERLEKAAVVVLWVVIVVGVAWLFATSRMRFH